MTDMRTVLRAALIGCLTGAAIGGLLEAKYGFLSWLPVLARPSLSRPDATAPSADPKAAASPRFRIATYHGQEISNQVRLERLVLPAGLRRDLKNIQAEEVALRDRALGLKTLEEVEAAKKEYLLLQDKRQLVQNFILQDRSNLNQWSVLHDFIVTNFSPEFPVILEANAYDQLVSSYTGAFGPQVEVTDLTDRIIQSLREEINGETPSHIR